MNDSSTRRALLRGAGVVGLAGLAGCLNFGAPAIDQSTLTVSPEGATTVVVGNENGDVVVEPGEGPDIELEVTRRVFGSAGLFGDVAIETGIGEDTVEISTFYETPQARRVTVDLVVRLPDGLTLTRASTGNGDVTAEGIPGDAVIRTANGNATARDVDGTVSLQSGNGDATATRCTAIRRAEAANGDVSVEVRNLPDATTAAAGNGNVAVGVARGLDADVLLRVGNGTIEVDNVALADRTSGQGQVTGRLGEGGPRLEASVGNGDVRLYLLEN